MPLGSPTYPTTLNTDVELYAAKNLLQSKPSADIGTSDTTVSLVDASNFPATGGICLVDAELFTYTGKSGNNLTGVTKGYDGTTSTSHNTSSYVKLIVAAQHHNVISTAIKNIEVELGTLPKGTYSTVKDRLNNLLDKTAGGTVTGAIIYQNTLTGRQINPETDNTYDLGTASLRWRSLYLTPTSLQIIKTLGDTNPVVKIGDARIDLGAGGASAVDVSIYRSAANEITIPNSIKVSRSANANLIIFNQQGTSGFESILFHSNLWPLTISTESTSDSIWGLNITSGATINTPGTGTSVFKVSAAGQVKIPITGSAGGLLIGGDTNLYRSAADTLKTDDNFITAADFYLNDIRFQRISATEAKINSAVEITREVVAGLHCTKTTITSGNTITIDSGEQAIVFQQLTINGTLVVNGELRITAWPS
ncbi:MAG: hypothetical protein AABY07_00255 [Nanoarchaeota archaeon]